MAATLNITDGATTVNLLSAKVDYQLRAGGWSQSDPELKQIRRQSQFAEGESLILSNPGNIIETFTIAIYGASHDGIATNLQNLATLQREAKEFQTTRWQTTPVYLTAKTANETNTRYALVVQIRVVNLPSLQDVFFNNQSAIPQATIIVEREPYWRGVIPMSALPTALTIGAPQAPGTQADATEQYITNFRDTFALTHIYNEDNSLGTFSANLIASSSFNYYTVAATPALNDAVYFGSTQGPFRQVVINIGVAGVFNAAMTWEIWTGAAWVSTVNYISTDTLALQSGSAPVGTHLIVVESPVGWATTTINGVSAYWIRVRITSFTSWTTSPTQTGQVVYNPRDAYISVANTQIDGDVDAIGLLKYFHQVNRSDGLAFIAFGIKSHGLTSFISRFNFGAGNPAAWTITNGSDTTTVADTQSPGGSRASCTFTGTTAAAERVRVSTVTNQNIIDLQGRYHAYLRCQQIGGTVGAVSVYLRQTYALITDGPAVSPKAVGGGIEILDLGAIEILGSRILGAETGNLDLRLSIIASATSTTPDLYIYDLCLIPTDEYALAGNITDGTVIADERTTGLDFDGGLFRDGEIVYKGGTDGSEATSVIANWEHRGQAMRLPPDRAFQIHFIMASVNTNIYYAREYLGGSLKLYVHERWAFMRGAE